MKYPAHTISQPLSESQFKRVLNAVETGVPITNPEYEATISRILREHKQTPKEQSAHHGTNGNRAIRND
jgi:hypothetical protein